MSRLTFIDKLVLFLVDTLYYTAMVIKDVMPKIETFLVLLYFDAFVLVMSSSRFWLSDIVLVLSKWWWPVVPPWVVHCTHMYLYTDLVT